MTPNLNDLYLFAKVAEHGGFSAAARALGLPKSTLSRRVAALEQELGVRLFQRSGNRFTLTDIGLACLRRCEAMIAEAEAARHIVEQAQAEPSGLLRVSCPIALAQSRVSGTVARFLSENPRVSVQLIATNRRIDPIEEGIDVALRVRFPPIEDSNLVMRTLATSAQLIVARPALLDRLGRPSVPEDLTRFDSMDLIHSGAHAWDFTNADGRKAIIRFAPRFVSDDMVALRHAAIDGVGVVRLPEYLVQDQIRRGELEALLPEWTPRPGIVHAVFPSRRGLATSVRNFVDFLAQDFKMGNESV